MLNAFNAMSKMKEYSIFQIIRIVSIIGSIIVIYLLGIPPIYVCLSLTVSEIILFTLIMAYSFQTNLIKWTISFKWCKKHILFGVRALPSYVVLDLNSKVDIICLGILVADNTIIGIYSFAALFVEGFYQLYVVVRRSINPHIAKMYREQIINQSLFNKKEQKTTAYYCTAYEFTTNPWCIYHICFDWI